MTQEFIKYIIKLLLILLYEIKSGENENRSLFEGVRRNIAKILVGEQDAITVIGPASVVKDITKDPKKIELMLSRK